MPLSPYRLRMYKQTDYGMTRLLAPLIAADAACIFPFQGFCPERPLVIELCPALTLKEMKFYCSYTSSSGKDQTAGV